MRIREIASGLQFPEGPIAMDDGSILLVEIARGTLSRVTPDGKVTVACQMGGGPNGAAMGADGEVYVCNNGGFEFHTESNGTFRPVAQAINYAGGRLERVNLNTGKFERLISEVAKADGSKITLKGPNDLVFDHQGGLYFTDLGKVRATEMDRGGVYYFNPASGEAKVIAHPALTPNGIALSPDDKTLYYAETEGARLWAFDLTGAGTSTKLPFPSPHGGRLVAACPGGGYQRFDSIAVDAFGNIVIATLLKGGISTIAPDGTLLSFVPTHDIMTTNICFGGPDMRTAYITLSGIGKLIAIDDWPVPGLRLAYNA
jgi:gluconolactonase